ncbi:MAG TPA: DUF4129 domain-containing protein [Verrucomicrobiae bacterium]|nr:DUF4129 domain-containing protein [Verrucomicrobiae bacterium]
MDLEKVTAVIRPRSYWESIDLGFRMVSEWPRAVFAPWLSVTVPLALALSMAFWDRPMIAALVVWWLKPILDRIPLYVLSRALFGSTPTTRETLAAFRGLAGRGAVKALTMERLDTARSFNLPIGQLEGLSGRARAARRRVLGKGCSGEARQLTFMSSVFELVVAAGVAGLVFLMTPDAGLDASIESLARYGTLVPSLGAQWLLAALYMLAMLVVEPFYVGAGFGLYLNRRTRLEAWDVEISFRTLARRLRSIAAAGGLVASVVLLALGAGPVAWSASAAEPVARGANRDPARLIRQILSDPEFGGTRPVKTWRVKPFDLKPKGEASAPRWLETLGEAFAAVAQPILWVLFLGALIFVLVRVIRAEPARRTGGKRLGIRAPDTISGLDVRPETFPPDIPGAARLLWSEGKADAALGLLYRGALARLVTVEKLPLERSSTEGDCLRIAARRLPPGRAAYFRGLTESWQSAAYGRRPPDEGAAQQILAAWSTHFGASL